MTVLCGMCGAPARGYASWYDGTRLCHDDSERPSCYELACWGKSTFRFEVVKLNTAASKLLGEAGLRPESVRRLGAALLVARRWARAALVAACAWLVLGSVWALARDWGWW